MRPPFNPTGVAVSSSTVEVGPGTRDFTLDTESITIPDGFMVQAWAGEDDAEQWMIGRWVATGETAGQLLVGARYGIDFAGGELQGTISTTAASTTVTGTGTLFTEQLAAGDGITIIGVDGESTHIVDTVTSDTSLEVTAAWGSDNTDDRARKIAEFAKWHLKVADTPHTDVELFTYSDTSFALAPGSKTFTVEGGKFFPVGSSVLGTALADPTQHFAGIVSAYSGTSLTVFVTSVTSGGTFSSWSIYDTSGFFPLPQALLAFTDGSFVVPAQGDTITIEGLNQGQEFEIGDHWTIAYTEDSANNYFRFRVIAVNGADVVATAYKTVGSGNGPWDSWAASFIGPADRGVPFDLRIGLNFNINTSDPNHDIDFAQGIVRDDEDQVDLRLATALTKRSDAVWAAGNNQGGAIQSANLAGTMTLSTSTNVVSGAGTQFLTDFQQGSLFTTAGGETYVVYSVASNTSLKIQSNADAAGYRPVTDETNVTFKRGAAFPLSPAAVSLVAKHHAVIFRNTATGAIEVGLASIDAVGEVDVPSGYMQKRKLGIVTHTLSPAFDYDVQNVVNDIDSGKPNIQRFNIAGMLDTWYKPDFHPDSLVRVRVWGAGGSGARSATATNGGGGGGAFVERSFKLSELGSTEIVLVGVGGGAKASNANGDAGGDSTFGSGGTLVTAYGGAGGRSTDGGGGGGPLGAPTNSTPGEPRVIYDYTIDWNQPNSTRSLHGQGGVALASGANSQGGTQVGKPGIFHGGGGGRANSSGGNSVWGGAGGGGNTTTASASGGTSINGGAGGASAINGADATAGSQPGGGGGGSEGVASGVSGAGGDGRVEVVVFPA